MKKCSPTASPEQYLAIGAGLHHIADHISATAYPIQNWSDLEKAAHSIHDRHLIVPGGKTALLKELMQPTISDIKPIVGDQYFPINDKHDFALKASLVLITLVMRHVGAPSETKLPNERTAAEIQAFKQKLAGRGRKGE